MNLPPAFVGSGQCAHLTVASSADLIHTGFLSQKKQHLARESSWWWSSIGSDPERLSSFQAAVCSGTASTSRRRPVSMSNTKPLTGTSFAIQGCDLTFLICSRVFCSGSENGFAWLMGSNHCGPPDPDVLANRPLDQLGVQGDRGVEHLGDWTILLGIAGHSSKRRFVQIRHLGAQRQS